MLKMKNLELCFERAKQYKAKYVAVLIEIEGFPEPEVIVNPIRNLDSKLAYYQKTYDENLVHKNLKDIKIVGCTFGQDMKEIEEDFI